MTSIYKVLDLLTLLSGVDRSYRVSELANIMNLPRSTLIYGLDALVGYGLVRREGQRYRISKTIKRWASVDRHHKFHALYRPLLEHLAEDTGELVLLGLLDGAGVIHIDYIESDHAVRVAPAPQTHHNIRFNALGKLILSGREDLAKKWIEEDPAFADELETIRKTGVAWNREETVTGMIALATHGIDPSPVEPKFAVAWPANRFTEERGKKAVQAIRKLIREYAPHNESRLRSKLSSPPS